MSTESKTIVNYSDLKEYGINWLTGERDPYGFRILFDLTEQGKEIVCNFFGLPLSAEFDKNWNSGAVASIMMSKQTLKDLIKFILFHIENMDIAVENCNGSFSGYQNAFLDKFEQDVLVEKHVYYNMNQSRNNFNVHAFSGRG